MRKLNLIVVLSFLLIGQNGYCENVNQPSWEEFCPSKYINAKQVKGDKEQSYWFWRRLQFEQAITKCETKYTDEDLETCYDEIRLSEERKKERKISTPINSNYEAMERTREKAGAYNENNMFFPGFGTLIDAMREE